MSIKPLSLAVLLGGLALATGPAAAQFNWMKTVQVTNRSDVAVRARVNQVQKPSFSHWVDLAPQQVNSFGGYMFHSHFSVFVEVRSGDQWVPLCTELMDQGNDGLAVQGAAGSLRCSQYMPGR